MSFFKAYDMRGTFGVDFDLKLVEAVGRALPSVISAANRAAFPENAARERPRILVGRDCRETSPQVHAALVEGLLSAGAEVLDLGLCTTSMVYFFTAFDDFDGSVMVTASHNPPSDNGLKVSMRTALPVGYANGLNRVEELVKTSRDQLPRASAHPPAEVLSEEMRARYIDWQRLRTPPPSLRVAVDCSNGMSGLLVKELFPGAVILNDRLDGSFPAHSPNPLKAEAREQIAAVVREQKLDCGVIFDGDADRAMFVDENGAFVQPDYLIPVIARATRRLNPEADYANVVLHDVRTSRAVIESLVELGFQPRMVPVGHAFAKPVMRSTRAICGGELAGHYYFGEFFGCDSGILAALRILSEIAEAKRRGETFSQMMAPIVTRYANSGECNFKVEDKEGAIARVLKAAQGLSTETGRSEMDGYRLEFPDGWISVRKSNTEPYLRLLVEADTQEKLQSWMRSLTAAIQSV